jgi:hypothetical protein
MDAIHHEVPFKASRSRVDTLLTNAQEFQKVVALSGAVVSGKVKTDVPHADWPRGRCALLDVRRLCWRPNH